MKHIFADPRAKALSEKIMFGKFVCTGWVCVCVYVDPINESVSHNWMFSFRDLSERMGSTNVFGCVRLNLKFSTWLHFGLCVCIRARVRVWAACARRSVCLRIVARTMTIKSKFGVWVVLNFPKHIKHRASTTQTHRHDDIGARHTGGGKGVEIDEIWILRTPHAHTSIERYIDFYACWSCWWNNGATVSSQRRPSVFCHASTTTTH